LFLKKIGGLFTPVSTAACLFHIVYWLIIPSVPVSPIWYRWEGENMNFSGRWFLLLLPPDQFLPSSLFLFLFNLIFLVLNISLQLIEFRLRLRFWKSGMMNWNSIQI
jgi:hypothetical protein